MRAAVVSVYVYAYPPQLSEAHELRIARDAAQRRVRCLTRPVGYSEVSVWLSFLGTLYRSAAQIEPVQIDRTLLTGQVLYLCCRDIALCTSHMKDNDICVCVCVVCVCVCCVCVCVCCIRGRWRLQRPPEGRRGRNWWTVWRYAAQSGAGCLKVW
jgi:hypothetical protein